MDRQKMAAMADKNSVTVWFAASCKKDMRFLGKVIDLFAKEVQTRVMINGDWDVVDLVEVGGEMMAFLNAKTNEAEAAEDAEIMEDDEDETTA